MANNLMYLKGLKDEDGSQLGPILVTTSAANLVDDSTLSGQLSGLSGYLQSQINSLSANLISTGSGLQSQINSLSGSAFIKNQTNTGNLILANNSNINVLSGNININSGTLGLSGTTNFIYNTVTNSGTDKVYAPSGYFAINLNGTGVRVPFFRA
jgi:hypothetical protein